MNKAKNIESREIDGETILVSPKKNEFFILNKTGTFIWKNINGKNTEKNIAEKLAKKYNLKEKISLADTKKLIKKLASMKLITKKN